MKLSATDQESLVALLARIYLDIRDIEEELQLIAGEGDFRPRIEYFHDAIRAFTAREKARLTVELLAYDISCLRYIVSQPLSPFKPQGGRQSPQKDVMVIKEGNALSGKRPGREQRARISELYQHYAVLFAALLKPLADHDADERIHDLNQDVEEIHTLVNQLESLGKGKTSLQEVVTAVHHLDDDNLRQFMTAFLQQGKYKKQDDRKKITQLLKTHAQAKDKAIATIEKAHMNYAMAQLGVFESSKDVLKKMAGQGMNLVGKFVEAAAAETRRQMGR